MKRRCRRCDAWKPEDCFAPGKKACEPCREAERQYYSSRREQLKAANLARYYANRQAVLRKCAEYYQANKSRRNAVARAYARANRHVIQNVAHKRRAALVNTPNPLTSSEWKEILESFGNACAYCGRSDVPMTMDHVEPLTKGGPHAASNVVPACKHCNCVKQRRGVLAMTNTPFSLEKTNAY